mmetsp:Transcript_7508/g.13001  ORF Transcript_7508/g.13001 Transcript_7508/m.13001 type:complete len:343 (-) Transcript_7508:181-1209(-)
MRARFCVVWVLPVCSAWSAMQQIVSVPQKSSPFVSRRDSLAVLVGSVATVGAAQVVHADEEAVAAAVVLPPVEVVATGDAKQLFNQGRVLEMQGNIAAAQRIYAKVTKMSPRFIYAWSNLGNTQVALGVLNPAEESYNTAINLCQESIQSGDDRSFGVRRCDDLYVLLLNRGCLRLNSGREKEALDDLVQASILRGRPDAVVAQNLARARELNGMYDLADREYNLAISMTSNEVSPFWLRSALVKMETGDVKGGFDLLKRVAVRFPEAPEVRAAYATFLVATGDQIAAQQKYLEIPDRQRLNYVDQTYLEKTIAWPPEARRQLAKVTSAVGDADRAQTPTSS